MLCPTLWDWDATAPCHLWNWKCWCFLCPAFRALSHGFDQPSLGLSCCYSVTDPWGPKSCGFDLPSLGCDAAVAALRPTFWVLSHGTDLPSEACNATALCHAPCVLSHSFGLTSQRPSCCCSARVLVHPPPQGHAVAVPLILGASHCCILSFHSCVLPSWGPNYCGDPQRLRSWLLGRSAHACTSDIWSAIITSAPGPQDLVSLLHCVPVHQTWYQEAFPLDRTPCHRKKRRKGRPLQSLPRRTPTALDTTAAYRTFVVSVKEEPHSLCQCWPQLM